MDDEHPSFPPPFLRWLEERMGHPRAAWGRSTPELVVAKSRDTPDGDEVEIDERFFMEWVELGLKNIRERLNAETRMDEIDKQRRGESDGSAG